MTSMISLSLIPAIILSDFVPASRVMRSRRHVRLDEVMDDDMRIIPLELDQEDVAHMFRQYGLISAPVV